MDDRIDHPANFLHLTIGFVPNILNVDVFRYSVFKDIAIFASEETSMELIQDGDSYFNSQILVICLDDPSACTDLIY